MKRDYYDVLEVTRDSTPEDIKRSYKRLAVRFHPDRNPGDAAAEDRFKEATEAYTVLSDPEKRRRYDRLGHAAFEATGGPGGFDPRDIGSMADILEGLLGEMFGGRRTRRGRSGRDIEVELQITFEEAALGVEKPLRVNRPTMCDGCGGTGAQAGTQAEACAECRGRGEVRFQRGIFMSTRACQLCRGTGKRIDHPCATCQGTGSVLRDEEMQVKVPPGVEDGAVRTVRGSGEMGPGGAGDLHVHIKVLEHPLFTREGADVILSVPVSFPQAVLGATIEVPTLEGAVSMKIPAGTQSGKVFRLRGKGIPVFGGYGKGDQLVKIMVEVPQKLTRKARKLMEELAQELGVDSYAQQKSFLEKLKSLLE